MSSVWNDITAKYDGEFPSRWNCRLITEIVSSHPREDGIGILLRARLSTKVPRDVLAFCDGTKGSLLNLIGVGVEIHVPVDHQLELCTQLAAHRSIIKLLRSRAVGLARPFPAISGADPWTASNILASLPMFPEGVRPRPPMRPADKSERISPYLQRFSRNALVFLGIVRSQVRHDHDPLGEW